MCAASNPFRTSDLIAKYGWKVMPYLSNLGVRSLAEAQVLFVDSGHTNALDADDTEHGHSFEKPLATADYAVGLLVASEGGIILLAPGHNENIAASETLDFDVVGITCISLGTGTLRARFDFDAANSAINVGANNVTLIGLTYRPGFADVLIGIDIEAAVTNTRIIDCEALEGEAAGDEFLAAIELKAGCHDTVVENNLFRAGLSSNPDDGISLNGASNRVTLKGNRFSGPYGDAGGVTAAISNSTGVCLDLLIENNIMKVKDGESGIEVIATTPAVIRHNLIISTGLAVDSMIVGTIAELDQNVGVTTDGTSGEFIKGGALAPDIIAYNLDHLAKTSTAVIVDDPLGGYVTALSILGHIMATDADPDNFDASTDSLQSIATAVAGITNQTGVINAVPQPPTAQSLQDILHKDTNYTYAKSTDSLEAISDSLLLAVGDVGSPAAGSALDILKKLYYTADGGSTAYPSTIANDSALAKIMVKGTPANIDQFDNTTHSLEAIADAVTGFTTAVSTTPTARSVQDILEKDGGGTFSAADDSLEAISDLLRTGTALLTGINLDHFMKTAVGDEQDMGPEIAIASVLAHIMVKGAGGDVNDFDPTTDSLQAIRDNQQTAARAAIDDAELDHLCELDGTTAYAENIANDSIIAKIMCVGAVATPNTFDNTEDSLQAISEFVRTGTTLGAGIQLDHLLKTSTGVTLDLDLTAYTADFSVMAHVMSATAVGSTFDASTDSLEAISVALAAGTGVQTVLDTNNLDHLAKVTTTVNADDSLASYVITKSILAHIMSANADVTTGYNASTDSLAAIGADNDTIIADIATAQSDLNTLTGTGGANLETATQTQVDDILADTAVIEPGARRIAIKATGDLTGFGLSQNLFTVSGDVLVRVCASVDVAVTSTSGTTTLEVGIAGNTACLCIQDIVDGAAFVIGDSWTKTVAASDNGAELADEYVIVGNGATIILTGNVDDITAGDIDFYCEWIPLSAGATVTAA